MYNIHNFFCMSCANISVHNLTWKGKCTSGSPYSTYFLICSETFHSHISQPITESTQPTKPASHPPGKLNQTTITTHLTPSPTPIPTSHDWLTVTSQRTHRPPPTCSPPEPTTHRQAATKRHIPECPSERCGRRERFYRALVCFMSDNGRVGGDGERRPPPGWWKGETSQYVR